MRIFLFVFSVCISLSVWSQNGDYTQAVQKHQDSLRTFYSTPETTILKGEEMKTLSMIENAYVYIEHDTIIEYGKMEDYRPIEANTVIDATG